PCQWMRIIGNTRFSASPFSMDLSKQRPTEHNSNKAMLKRLKSHQNLSIHNLISPFIVCSCLFTHTRNNKRETNYSTNLLNENTNGDLIILK
ncbi:MAG: hypothetical protein V7771_18805, partial [Shewanella psychromarinicola]|uniref:hypothetical protein n=1 Tax=Shewanella psychromarinicola TaxID=2487742 RepID=UPI0030017B2C